MLGFCIVRENARVNDGMIGTGENVIGEFARFRRDIADNCCRTIILSRYLALELAHMAVLTGYAPRCCR